MRRTLDGMTALVSGSTSGIGEALARDLLGHGVRVAINGRRREKLDALKSDLGDLVEVVPGDVSTAEECERIVNDTFDALGRLDVLVCNAGYGATQLSWKQTPDDVRRMFATNVHGTHDLIYHAVPRMLEQPERDGLRGQLMLVSSAAARRGIPYLGPYAATKAAQLSLAEALRVELGEDGIAVTSVHPAGTKTEFGDVAEREGEVAIDTFAGRGGSQTAEQVATAMRRAIQKPTAEVWPNRPYRILLGIGTLMPRGVDRGMRKLKRDVERQTPSTSADAGD
ncbi:MAG: SDR family oxidoreductase [Planctomycetota bacterium]